MSALDDALADYIASGDPIKVVAKRHKVSRDRLCKTAREAGASRPRGPSHPPEVRAAALADYRNGMSVNALSDKHGVSRHIIRNWLEQEYGGEDPIELTGGRWIREGLVSRWQYDVVA